MRMYTQNKNQFVLEDEDGDKDALPKLDKRPSKSESNGPFDDDLEVVEISSLGLKPRKKKAPIRAKKYVS